MKKLLLFHPACKKDFLKLERSIRKEFFVLFRVLEDKGMLKEPDGKKLSGHKGLFEIRVKVKTNWRLFYAYALEDKILLLHLINKKTQKTPVNEINLAKKRLREYE